MKRSGFEALLKDLEGGDTPGAVPFFVETPKDRRNKYKYDPELGLFTLGGVLPAGAVFPYDFGFVPYTLAEDGDPIDVLAFMDEPAFPGCLLAVRLVGVLEARQTEDDETFRNDRLLAVAATSRDHRGMSEPDDVPKNLRKEIETFFVDYNEQKGRTFEPLGWFGPKRARRLLAKARGRFERKPSPPWPSPSPSGPAGNGGDRKAKDRGKRAGRR